MLVYDNRRMTPDKKQAFYLTYSLIFLSSMAEWVGIRMNGNMNVPGYVLHFVKCCDYILTPLAGAAFVAQLRVRSIWTKILHGIVLFNLLFQIASLFTDWTVYIDGEHTYNHGSLYWIYMLIYLLITIIVVIQFRIYDKRFKIQNRFTLYLIMGFVLPQFSSMFEQMDELPFATELLMNISDFVANRWYLLIFFGIILYIAFKIITSFPEVRLVLDRMQIHLPKIGKLRKIIYTARFSRTLASMYSAGIPIVTCLQIAKTTIGNSYIESQFDDLIAEIRSGKALSEALAEVDGFVKKLPSSVAVGEETGALDSMLVSIADQMDYDSEIAIEKLVAMVEPIMIVVMAVVVGFIMVAVITPIYGSYQTIADQGK